MPGFEWDEPKRLLNEQKHGLDFVDRKTSVRWTQCGKYYLHRLYGGARPNHCEIGGTFYTAVWTPRGDSVRLISFRRARDAKSEHIVRYSAEEMSKLPSRSDWERATRMTEEEIEAAIASDPDERDMVV